VPQEHFRNTGRGGGVGEGKLVYYLFIYLFFYNVPKTGGRHGVLETADTSGGLYASLLLKSRTYRKLLYYCIISLYDALNRQSSMQYCSSSLQSSVGNYSFREAPEGHLFFILNPFLSDYSVFFSFYISGSFQIFIYTSKQDLQALRSLCFYTIFIKLESKF
jgi:hypothetical protein